VLRARGWLADTVVGLVPLGTGNEVVVEGRAFRCNVDGELVGPTRHRTWRVEPDAWTMLAPRPGVPGPAPVPVTASRAGPPPRPHRSAR